MRRVSRTTTTRRLVTPAPVIADNPTAYWRLGEQNGAIANDAVGSRDGTYVNSPAVRQFDMALPYDVDTAVAFDGSNDHVLTGITDAIAPPLSVEAWIKTTDTDGGIVNKYVSSSHNGFQVFMVDGQLAGWYFADEDNYTRTDGSGQAIPTWQLPTVSGITRLPCSMRRAPPTTSMGSLHSTQVGPVRWPRPPKRRQLRLPPTATAISRLLDEVAIYGYAARCGAGPGDTKRPSRNHRALCCWWRGSWAGFCAAANRLNRLAHASGTRRKWVASQEGASSSGRGHGKILVVGSLA